MTILKSPLNYTGGKYKLLPQLLPLFPKEINTFVDLFGGGANVGINVKANKIIINDIVSDLINLYKTLQSLEPFETFEYIHNRISEFKLSMENEDGYRTLRKIYNEQKHPLDFFLLVCYSFNHSIGFNNNGGFNVAFGRDRSAYNKTIEYNLKDFINVIKSKNIEFTNLSFKDFYFSNISENDFVYTDPPYLITNANYNKFWNDETEKEFLKTLKGLSDRNIKFGISNVLEHLGRENTIFKEWIEENNFHITYIEADYSNSSYQLSDKTSKSVEVFVTNYKPVSNIKKLF